MIYDTYFTLFIKGQEEGNVRGSKLNKKEAEKVVSVVMAFLQGGLQAKDIGVITHYKLQVPRS